MKLGLIVSWVYLVIIMLMQNEGSCNGCLENERIGLLEFKDFVMSRNGGDYAYYNLASWVDDRDSNCCSWNGVKCSNISYGHITELSLHDLLYSPLPILINVSLFRPFEELRFLGLTYNHIDGLIGNEGSHSLKKLETLDLSWNRLNYSILSNLNGLTSLTTLNLSMNRIDKFSHQGLCKLKDLEELDISNNMFSGKLPECLSNLTNLKVLDVSYNSFSGSFPSFTTNLTSLIYLSLYGNHMNGSFSLSTFANHSNLQVLYISSESIGAHIETETTKWFPKFQLKSLILRNCNLNKDKGNVIPSFLSHQYNLILIDLSRNKLVGSFPSGLKQNDGIQYLDISKNNLSGLLPKDIGIFLPSVTFLNFSWNGFEGNIPSSIGKMKTLAYLDLSYNHFSGELPKQLATNCNELGYLKLSNNLLQGNLPKFSSLKTLFLNNNNFSGTFEDVLGNNTSLEVLDISNNSISGTIPSSIGMFSNTRILLMAENLLEGEIPIEISNLYYLDIMDLSQNKLTGSVPEFSSLRFLYLKKNELSGSIPFELSKNSQLELLDLRDNKFSGKIPNWMDNLSKLRAVLLGGNNLEGEIPIQLCHLKKINIMDLSRNMLVGSIPSCFQNLSFGIGGQNDVDPIFDISMWDGYGPVISNDSSLFINSTLLFEIPLLHNFVSNLQLEVEFRTKHYDYPFKGKILENMTGLDLSCNRLTGIIPSQIGDLQQIRALNLSHNYLSGHIPSTFSNLTQIESLDLSYNNLSGKVPYELAQLHFLSTFNVSYNNLSGTPPSTGQFGNFDEENYRGNSALCGPLLNRKCEGVAPPPSSQSDDSGEKETQVDMVSFYWSFAGSYITILLAFITVLCINARWRMAWFYYIGKVMRTCFPTFPLY